MLKSFRLLSKLLNLFNLQFVIATQERSQVDKNESINGIQDKRSRHDSVIFNISLSDSFFRFMTKKKPKMSDTKKKIIKKKFDNQSKCFCLILFSNKKKRIKFCFLQKTTRFMKLSILCSLMESHLWNLNRTQVGHFTVKTFGAIAVKRATSWKISRQRFFIQTFACS